MAGAKGLGASPRLGEWLGRQPEVLQLLDDEEVLARPHTRDDVMGGVEGLLKRGGGRVSRAAQRRPAAWSQAYASARISQRSTSMSAHASSVCSPSTSTRIV